MAEQNVRFPSAKVRRLWVLVACIWLGLAIYAFASGEYRQQSALRNGADVALALLSVFMLWEVWRTRKTGA